MNTRERQFVWHGSAYRPWGWKYWRWGIAFPGFGLGLPPCTAPGFSLALGCVFLSCGPCLTIDLDIDEDDWLEEESEVNESPQQNLTFSGSTARPARQRVSAGHQRHTR